MIHPYPRAPIQTRKISPRVVVWWSLYSIPYSTEGLPFPRLESQVTTMILIMSHLSTPHPPLTILESSCRHVAQWRSYLCSATTRGGSLFLRGAQQRSSLSFPGDRWHPTLRRASGRWGRGTSSALSVGSQSHCVSVPWYKIRCFAPRTIWLYNIGLERESPKFGKSCLQNVRCKYEYDQKKDISMDLLKPDDSHLPFFWSTMPSIGTFDHGIWRYMICCGLENFDMS